MQESSSSKIETCGTCKWIALHTAVTAIRGAGTNDDAKTP